MKEAFEDLANKKIKSLVPLLKRPVENIKSIPNIVNMVSTTSILPPGYRLPLKELSAAMGPCSQYAPVQFAANILKFTTSTTDSTILVFASGKLVLVSAVSENHTRYMNQFFRVIIEQIKCVMLKNEKLWFGTLMGRTVFENNVTHNVVGHGDLGMKINLNALRDANPGSVKYLHDSFPAAKCSVWLTEDCKCHCSEGTGGSQPPMAADEIPAEELEKMPNLKRALKKKCHCTIKCLCFDTGKIVMIGGEKVRDVNAVFYKMQQMIPQFQTTKQFVLPKEEQFEHKIGAMLVQRDYDTSAISAIAQQKKKTNSTMSPHEEIALVIYQLDKFRPKYFNKVRKIDSNNTVVSPLIQFALDGRVNELKMLLLMDPDLVHSEEAREAIRLVKSSGSVAGRNQEIIKLLQ